MTVSGKRRLGRGLEALLGPTSVPEAAAAGTLRQIPVKSIQPNPFQPRRTLNQDAIDELANSMATSGLLQPIVLRPLEGDKYQLIAGERRWRAATKLGWEEIGAVIKEVDDRTLLTLALVENIQRDALNAIDEATGYQRLVDDFQMSHSEVAELIGRSRPSVANSLRLLHLPKSVQDLVQVGKLQMGHARALLQLSNPKQIERLAKIVADMGLSVRETESRARGDLPPQQRKPRKPKANAEESAENRRVADALRSYLQTDVAVTINKSGRGRLFIDFYSNDDLTRVLELVLGSPFEG